MDIELTDEDLVLARELIEQGYLSTSNKYRQVSRLRTPLTGKDIVRPELHDTLAGRTLIERWDRALSRDVLRGHDPEVEHRELTIGQFRAFKQLGGQTA